MSHRVRKQTEAPAEPVLKKKEGRSESAAQAKQEIEILNQKIAEWVSKDPEKAALIISQWIHGEQFQGNKTGRKK
ncbi:MAG: hypothetical protein ACO3A2_01395 [Bdellovibrionia bacterium]